MKMSKIESKLKIQSLRVSSFVLNLDDQAKAIRGGDVDPEHSQKFCPSGQSFIGCLPPK